MANKNDGLQSSIPATSKNVRAKNIYLPIPVYPPTPCISSDTGGVGKVVSAYSYPNRGSKG